jgi:hypothetical protein
LSILIVILYVNLAVNIAKVETAFEAARPSDISVFITQL